MSTAPAPDQAPPPPPPQKRRRRTPWLGSLAGLLAPLAAGLVTLGLVLTWVLGTASGLASAIHLANLMLPEQIRASGVQGSIVDGLSIERLEIQGSDWGVFIDGLTLSAARFTPGARVLVLERVHARRLAIDWLPTLPPAPGTPPASLALPLRLELPELAVDEFALGERGSTPLVIAELRAHAQWDRAAIVIERASARLDALALEAQGRMDAAPPYAIAVGGRVRSTLAGHELAAGLNLGGTLTALELGARIAETAAASRGELQARITPFGALALESLDLSVRDFELADWVAGAPRARLSARAQLAPRADAAEFRLAGPLEVSNASPGPLDRGALPVRSARGSLEWSAAGLVIDVADLSATRGRAQGRIEWQPGAGLRAEARIEGADAAAIWSQLAPTDASGRLAYSIAQGEQKLVGELANRSGLPLAARFDLAIAAAGLRIRDSELRLGAGSARVDGAVRLAAPWQTALTATVQNLDLALLVPGLATRLSGELDLQAQFGSASPRGKLHLVLQESRVAGRPLAGRVDLALQDELLSAAADLRSASARLQASGSLGGTGSLEVKLEAPRLAELDPALAGALDARIEFAGDWRAPAFDLQALAQSLRLPGGHRVGKLQAAGHGALAADQPFDLRITLSEHQGPGGDETSFNQASLFAHGTLPAQTLSLSALSAAGQAWEAEARGGWRDAAWRGELVQASAGQPAPLRLEAPMPITLGAASQSLGPARFTLAGARFDEVFLARDATGVRTGGRFEDLRPQALDPARREVRRTTRSGRRDPLALRGAWNLAASPALNGSLTIERSGGDLYAGVAALTPLGIDDLALRLEARSGHLTGEFRARGAALGRATAQLDAWADTQGAWRLAPTRPLQLALDADLSSLGWLGPLISDNVQIEGKAQARVEVRGTPAEPAARGSARADGLRLAWVEQGLRLENGVAEAELEDGVLVLKRLEFTGPPRVRPDLAAASEGIPAGPGVVRGFGRLALASFTGSFALQAERLPVLQTPDRWIIASGEAGLALYGKRAELTAKLSADGAYIDFNKFERGPRLPDDVVVLRSRDARAAPLKPPVAVTIDASAELGPRFYIRGAGVEARLAGRVAIKGEAGALRAQGEVQTVGGTYLGYGQRLRIERGLVTFQGLLDNPSLNVLALRPNLPVAVGVAITGTAQKPVVRLYSDPSMPEQEKLNWLVLGRPADGTGQDRAMLAAAAGALFSGQTDAASSALMRGLGIDEISLRGAQTSSSLLPRETVAGQLRAGSTATQEVVAVGKRINDQVYLSFEQALSGSGYAIALSYQLTQALSLVGRAGTSNAIDLVWSIAFD